MKMMDPICTSSDGYWVLYVLRYRMVSYVTIEWGVIQELAFFIHGLAFSTDRGETLSEDWAFRGWALPYEHNPSSARDPKFCFQASPFKKKNWADPTKFSPRKSVLIPWSSIQYTPLPLHFHQRNLFQNVEAGYLLSQPSSCNTGETTPPSDVTWSACRFTSYLHPCSTLL